jgi:Family of unknown function (DUF5691)
VSTWQDLVTAGLIGTERTVVPAAGIPGLSPAGTVTSDLDSPFPNYPAVDYPAVNNPAVNYPAVDNPAVDNPAAGDPAAVLLDRAALMTAARRAGRRPGRAETMPADGPDARPAMSPAAGRRLARLLGGEKPELLAEWLAAAAGLGLRPPAQLLPALIDRASRSAGPGTPVVRRLAAEVGGSRARWLARLNPDWASLVAENVTGEDAWRLGTLATRRGYLAALRARDPGAAGDLVLASWDAAGPDERAMFLNTIADGLSLADEPLLETALDDRAAWVRRLAADLLAALPGSALAQRMARRAAPCLRMEQGNRGPHLSVVPPAEPGAAMRRDGIAPGPAAGRSRFGDRSRLMLEIVARTPLRTWTGQFGLAAAQIVAVPAGDWTPVLLAGWSRAAVAQRDQEWMTALVIRMLTGRRPGAGIEPLRQLARYADPRLGQPGALPPGDPEAPPVVRDAVTVLRFRYEMLKELADDHGDG